MADRPDRGRPVTHLKMERLEDRTTPDATFYDGRVLIGLTPGVEQSALAFVNSSNLVSSTQHLGFGVYKVNLQPGVTVSQAVATFNGRNGVRFAEPDYRKTFSITPNDPEFVNGNQWGLSNIGLNGANPNAHISATAGWDFGVGNGANVLAILDSGTEYTHPDLAANIWRNPGETPNDGVDNDNNGFIDDVVGWDFANNDNDPNDDVGHGTHVAGIAGAVGNNGIGVTGTAWNTRLMIVKIGGAQGIATSDVISGMTYAGQNGAKVLNGSYGGPAFSQAEYTAMQGLDAIGSIFVAAAGNDTKDNDITPSYPTSYDTNNLVSVASTDWMDNLSSFSNWGVVSVDVGAPGGGGGDYGPTDGIYSTVPGGTWDYKSGTSMASPMVAGALAMFWDANTSLTHQEVIDALYRSVDQIPSLIGRVKSGGRLDLANLMAEGKLPQYATGAGPGGGPAVHVYRGASSRPVASFFAYDAGFTGGVRVATADVNGDGYTDIIAVPGKGGGPNVRVFDGKTFQIVYDFQAFEPEFTGGLFVAARDMDNDGWAEIVVSADRGGGPRVTVFKPNPLNDGVIEVLANFFAYDTGFSGGVRIALGDMDGDGKADLVTAPGYGGGPNVRVYSGAELALGAAVMTVDAMAGNVNNRNGLFVAADDLTGDGIADVIVGSGAGTPVVRIYNGVTFDLYRQFTASGGPVPGLVLDQDTNLDGTSIDPGFPDSLIPPAVPPKQLPLTAKGETPLSLNGYQYGVRVATHDVNRDGVADLILGAGPTDQPKVSLVNGSTFGQIRNFQAYANFFYGGVFVGGAGVVAS